MEWSSIDNVSRTDLEKPFSDEKFKRAIFDSGVTKALGSGRFNNVVYQQC